MIKRPLVAVFLLLLLPGVSALSFTEDFESFSPGDDPSAAWYSYSEGGDAGLVVDTAPIIGGAKSMKFEGPAAAGAGGRFGIFTLAGEAQLTQLDFTVRGLTIADDGTGSRQVIQVQSDAPVRTMAEFYLFCTDAGNPTGCELRVRFEGIDTSGQVLVNTSVGDSQFLISMVPDWNTGTYRLFVDGVDDGVFPFLELPENIGRLRIAQDNKAYPLNVVLDNLFIDGASAAVVSEGDDIAQGFKNFAMHIRFTSPTSLFLLGVVFMAAMVLAVGIPMVALGLDNSVIPALSFFGVLAALWLVMLEWWPAWIGIAVIILVAALISLVIRSLLMGIKDASTNAGIVAGTLGYFIIASALLGFSGYATESIEVPTSSLDTPDDVEAQTNETVQQQSFFGAVSECVITFFSDCSRDTVSTTWATITDVAGTIFNFARTAFTFLFQLLTFSLPIPVVFNAMIVLPPAASLATVGFSFITRSGS